MAHRVRVASCLCCLASAVLFLPSPAAAAPPSCLTATVYTPVNTRAQLAAADNPCSDPDGDAYTLRLTSPPQHGTLAADGSYYDPAPGFHNVDRFSYEAEDTNHEVSTTATITIVVDSAPTCTDAAAATTAGHALPVDDLPCDDVDGPDEFTIIVDDGAHGTVNIDANGNASYLPDPGFVGTDSFPFWAEDDFGAVSETRRMTITVTSPPAATPVATPLPVPAPPPDRTAPAVTLKNASKKQALAITLTTNENSTASLTVTLDKATTRKLKLAQKVATLNTALKPGASTLKIKLSAKAAKAFKKLKAVKLTVTAVIADTAGNKTTKTLKVTLRK
jgi:hypothetical protein